MSDYMRTNVILCAGYLIGSGYDIVKTIVVFAISSLFIGLSYLIWRVVAGTAA